MVNIHNCKYLSNLSEVETFNIQIVKEESWFLNYKSFATENDVDVGEADTTGEVLNEFGFAVFYCPFCGARLD